MKELDYKQSKRVVLARFPKAHMIAFSGHQLVDGVEGIELSTPVRAYDNGFGEKHWIEAAKKIMAVSGD